MDYGLEPRYDDRPARPRRRGRDTTTGFGRAGGAGRRADGRRGPAGVAATTDETAAACPVSGVFSQRGWRSMRARAPGSAADYGTARPALAQAALVLLRAGVPASLVHRGGDLGACAGTDHDSAAERGLSSNG